LANTLFLTLRFYIVACCLKDGISEAEQMAIASQRFDNTYIRGNE
jgi:hypothetical protein